LLNYLSADSLLFMLATCEDGMKNRSALRKPHPFFMSKLQSVDVSTPVQDT